MLKLGAPAVSYQLVFPEVFFRADGSPGGFDAVLGNPPWDAIQFKSKEFLAGFDLGILEAPTARERSSVERRLLSDPVVGESFSVQQESFEQIKRANDKLYEYQKVTVDGDLAGRQLDAFRVFMERNARLLKHNGLTGVVVPSAFHANAGATGVRKLYLEEMTLQSCFSFENRKKLFDIHRSFKFAAVVARKSRDGTDEFPCGFYLHDTEELFTRKSALSYSRQIVRGLGGEYLLFFELRDLESVRLARSIAEHGRSFSSFADDACLRLQKQPLAFDMSKDSGKFIAADDIGANMDPRENENRNNILASSNILYLTEGKNFWQYQDIWESPPRYYVAANSLSPVQARNLLYYRVGMRAVASSTNERTAVFTVIGAATVAGHSVALERNPDLSKDKDKLLLVAVGNSFTFDWLCRQMMGANVTLFVLGLIPFPTALEQQSFLAHSCLRLVANHRAFLPLWQDQLGDAWREKDRPTLSLPVIDQEEARWSLRAAMDAVVADAYGLSRSDYEFLLATFNHRSYPLAPYACLEFYDELKCIGQAAFSRKYDPYWDVSLNQKPPEPLIDPRALGQQGASLGPLFDGPAAESVVPAQPPIKASSSTAVFPRQQRVSATPSPSSNGAFTTIAELIRSRGVITSSDAQQATGLDAAGVRPHLQKLVQEGLAVTEGQRRGMRYRRVDG
ncbi:Eco57I restriction-modification methylase domain-containing protein [Synechococcus sp. BA-132 BA5]|uniref:Eco57I restriction-modification methylase domain-containing protein n=1 Tax=Synechococcus sp. BA-132 BA5 TaxID=3110252 RepID=UPI002B1F5901|nr:hypothetical protein [Synechococcus sp. BA-132 BA5]MEA5415983.1 hypothetical protein [Synechococcus sp. BA-132 BA5]